MLTVRAVVPGTGPVSWEMTEKSVTRTAREAGQFHRLHSKEHTAFSCTVMEGVYQ